MVKKHQNPRGMILNTGKIVESLTFAQWTRLSVLTILEVFFLKQRGEKAIYGPSVLSKMYSCQLPFFRRFVRREVTPLRANIAKTCLKLDNN